MNQEFSSLYKRALLYGDALFDTLLYKNSHIQFAEAHFLRLVSGMRQLRMEIPAEFSLDYWKEQVDMKVKKSGFQEARVKTFVARNSEGYYTPIHQDIIWNIEVEKYKISTPGTYILGVYKDNFINPTPISNIKTTNRLINVLAGIYAKENEFDNVLILNQQKEIAESIHANIFIIKDDLIKTPPLSSGCIAGILRAETIKIINGIETFKLLEIPISIYDLQQADEVFITNSLIEIQAVTNFKRKKYATDKIAVIKESLRKLTQVNS